MPYKSGFAMHYYDTCFMFEKAPSLEYGFCSCLTFGRLAYFLFLSPRSWSKLSQLVLEKPADLSTKSFFSEIVASISDIKSTPDGRYIVSRDYMTLKLWDVNMEARPVKTINVHEHLRPQVRFQNVFSNDVRVVFFFCMLYKRRQHRRQ